MIAKQLIAAPGAAPTPAPAPNSNRLPPAPKTIGTLPAIGDVGTAQSGF
jgi:hypothetical protein